MNRFVPLASAVLIGLAIPGISMAQQTRSGSDDSDTPRNNAVPVQPVQPLSSTNATGNRRVTTAADEPDVYLDVPNLSVDEITLDVENLHAKVSLEARLANLLYLSAGADVDIGKVNLTIKGVKAQVLLKVRLDNVREIIDRTLTTLDRNPEIIEGLLDTVDNTVGTVGGVANNALRPGGVVSQTVDTVGNVADTAVQPGGVVSQTVNSLGQTVTRTVDAAGNLVERVLDKSGNVVSSRIVQRAAERATGD